MTEKLTNHSVDARDQPLTELQSAPQSSDGDLQEPMTEDGHKLRRYDRPREVPAPITPLMDHEIIRFGDIDAALSSSSLSDGGKALLRGLLEVGCTAIFPGGGAGIEYGSLLKTAARPEFLAVHVREASSYLHEQQVDVLIVPGMSGYPVGSMYSIVSGIPAILLKKQKHGTGSAPASDPGNARRRGIPQVRS